MFGEVNCFNLKYFPGIARLVTPSGLLDGIDRDTPIELVPVISIDCEATDRDPRTARIVEIAIVGDDYEFSSLVNPGVPIPADATAVHHITNGMVAGARRWPLVSTVIIPNAVPLAYNAEYDRTLIAAECKRNDVDNPVPDVEWIDPLVWARHLYSTQRSRSLGAMCELLAVPLGEAHRAANDAKAALAIWRILVQDSRMPRAYGQVVQMQRALAREQMEARRWR